MGAGRLEIDPDKLDALLANGFAAMNAIFDEHGFPEFELQIITEGVIEVITQAGMG